MTDMYRLSMQEIAKNLEFRKQIQNSATLVLGSRAGGLFRSQALYAMLSDLISRNLQELPRSKAFEECYHVFSTWPLSPTDLHNTIRHALQDVSFSHEDEALARLIQQGYFSDIITTNVDDMLEEALRHVGLRSGQDFEIVYPGADPLHPTPSRIKIIKVFGDFHSRDYAINERLGYLSAENRSFFKSLLYGDLLMVGIDPTWDKELLQACPPIGDTLWYVSEEASLPPFLVRLLRGRPGSIFSGADGQYSQFFPKLSTQMHPDETSHEEADGQQLEASQIVIEQEVAVQRPGVTYHKRTRIFVPYSREDKRHLERLHVHLKQRYVFDEMPSVWDDTKILGGADWRKEINQALAETRIAVPLVSANFFSSNYIMDDELPPLLEAAKSGEVIILPVIVAPCLFKETPLAQFQAINDPKHPLSSLKVAEQENVWIELAARIKKILDDDKH